MDDNEMKTLFKSLEKILRNQNEIMHELGIHKYSAGHGWDLDTGNKAKDCCEIARKYENR